MRIAKEDGGFYYYRFQVNGIRVHKSTGTKNKGEAESIAIAALTEARERAKGTYIPTIEELRKDWLQVNATEVSIGHWRNVNSWDSCGLDDIKIDRLSTEVVQTARGKVWTKPGRAAVKVSEATVAAWMRVLNLLMGFAIKRKIIPAKPYNIPMPRPQKKPKKILPLTKVKEWLAAVDSHARNPQVGTAARLMVGLGVRESEALGARWEWIDWTARTYTPGRIVGGKFKTKGKDAGVVDMPDWLYDYLLELRGPDPKLGLILPWKVVDGVEVAHPANFTRASMRAANVDMNTQGVTPHRLRGTWITQLLRMGVPLEEVQGMARHKSKLTTLGYYETSSEVRKEAQKKLAEKMGFS